MKHFACMLMACLLVFVSGSALAGNAPTSQFGFQGWPYRQNTNCGSCALQCGRCSSNDDCFTCPQCRDVFATAKPQAAQTAAPTQKPTAVPTNRPTAKPTPMPTLVPTAKPTAAPTLDTGHYTTDYVLAQEQIALNLLNQDRIANGLPALTLDAELSNIARIKSCDMNSNNYFAHESPTYGNAANMLKQFGYAYNGVGENIAHHATVEKSEAAFMSSAGHRANILGSQWKKVGIGVCIDKNGFVYVTQIFVR